MSTLGCTVTVANKTLAAAANDLKAGLPTALAGLKITWGRSTRLDQPSPSTLSLSVIADPASVTDALDLLAPGSPIAVEATASTNTAPATQTVLNAPARKTLTNSNPIHFPPAAFAPDGANPTAWDNLPRVTRGSSYTFSVTIDQLALQSTALLYIVYYAGPWASSRTLGEQVASRTSAGTLSGTINPTDEHIGDHIGMAIIINPFGATWKQITTTWSQTTNTWADLASSTISNATIARTGTTSATATPFMGRITDAVLQWDKTLKKARIDVTAKDSSAEHANMRISAQPWPAETAAARVARAIAATGQNIRTVLDPAPAAITVAAVDVDRQSPSDVLQDVATSTGAILWPAAHRTLGEYYRLEDLSKRISLYQLKISTNGTAYLAATAKGATQISAAALDRDITVERDTTDLATVVTVTWNEQTQDETGKTITTQRHETVQDAERLKTYGYRSISISTILNSQAAAQHLATETLARSAAGGWTIPRARWIPNRNPHPDTAAIRHALDATSRMGLPIVLTNVDEWIPGSPTIPVYLDGGTYTYDGYNWTLDLQLTRAATPGDSLPWNKIPQQLTWNNMDTLTWADLASVTN